PEPEPEPEPEPPTSKVAGNFSGLVNKDEHTPVDNNGYNRFDPKKLERIFQPVMQKSEVQEREKPKTAKLLISEDILVPKEEAKIDSPDISQQESIAVDKQPSKEEVKQEAPVSEIDGLQMPLADVVIEGVPDWSRPDFQCLFFRIGELNLAVPLVKLKGVISWSDKIARPANYPQWYYGVMMHRGKQARIIDTARLVLPEDHYRKVGDIEPGKIIFIGDGGVGLGCTDIADVVKLNPEEVRWREQESAKRPWLLGTVKKHLCALVDTRGFFKMIKALEKNSAS
ncbi:MAG: chemotaxis protein CheW, partial [Gammaproteobacteria bacterium]